MKMIILTLVSLMGLSAMADGEVVSGAIVRHELSCTSAERRVGISVSLECYTHAVAPEYSLKGCDILTSNMNPNARPRRTPLNIVSQTASNAVLKGASTFGSIKVELTKSPLNAEIYQNRKLEFTCEEGK